MAQIFEGQIRFGIHSGQQNTGYAEYVHLWQTVEGLGYDWASVFDHFIPIFTDPLGPCFEGPTLLAAMAARTSRIRCGILVLGNTYRNPAILANIATTIDHISNGRLEWGIGAGWWEMEHEEYHVPFPPVARRIRMLGEAAAIQKLLWTEHRANFQGRYYQLTDALAEPKPVQSPLPLWIGGAGERMTLRVVAEQADGWNTFLLPLDAYQRKLDALTEHCRAIGRDPNEIRKSLVFNPILGDDSATRARVDAMRAAGQTPIAGTPEQIAEQLSHYVAAGVGDFIVGARVPADYTLLERFINEVAPLLRAEAARQRATTRA